jgi:hypothetical protein
MSIVHDARACCESEYTCTYRLCVAVQVYVGEEMLTGEYMQA